jgi:hypothetical protein
VSGYGPRSRIALNADEGPDRLSFPHSVRVVRRRMARFAATPPRQRKIRHDAILEEILQERVVSSRNRVNFSGVKRKMSNHNLRPGSVSAHAAWILPSESGSLSEQY